MPKIGFAKSRMKEERRIALLPIDITKYIEHPEMLYFEKNYGKDLSITDSNYRDVGANVVDRQRAYSLEILCQPKFCDKDLPFMTGDIKTVFGWMHLNKNLEKTLYLESKKMTAIGWELMVKNKKPLFRKNSNLTGQIGVLHAMAYAGKIPEECWAAVIGRGNVGKGAKTELERLGVRKLTVYHTDNFHNLKRSLGCYDVIVNCACSKKEILSATDLNNMKTDALLIDIGGGCVGGYKYSAQSIYSPVTRINRGKNFVYCISHVPTLAYKTASKYISKDVAPYINILANGSSSETLENATIIKEGIANEERFGF